jgi:Tfp pilus assembly protein PilX
MERAQAELFSARLSKLQQATGVQEMAFHRAQQAVREAEEKMALLKKWTRELENRSEPLVRLVDQLHGFLTTDMNRAVAYLAQVVQTLDAYADVSAPGAAPPPTSLTDREEPTSNSQHPEKLQTPNTNVPE